MLSTPDAHLVARDPAIRGLASVLDPEAALRTFREAAPDLDLRSLTVEYLRYKPGTNCLARLSVDVAGVRTPGYAKAYADVHRPPTPRPEARAFLAKSTAIEFGLFPFDRKLESLPIASDLAWASDRTPRATAGGPRSAVVAIEPLAYKPERRFVACWHLEDGRRYVAKTYRAEDFPNVVRRAGLARSFPDLPLVRPATIRERRHTMVFPWIAGSTLDATLALGAMPDADLRATGAALARLHRESPPADFSELPSARTDVPHAETR
ncbi:MAG: hypothetical protein JNL97_11845, partial [Verrucomicrobiales bacterium]|nr:hypothetical protein [Verrucomicrobiales bacterium]